MAGNRNSGRRPKSIAQHQRDGTYRPVRHEGVVQPESPKGAPERPAHLSEAGRAEWDRMVAELQACKMLFTVDRAMLYQYVQLYAWVETRAKALAEVEADIARLRKAMKGLDPEAGLSALTVLADLRKAQVRLGAQVASGIKAVRPYLVEFGFSPGSRSRVRLPPETRADEDDFTTFQQQRGQVAAFPRSVK